jgi:hypothetical protein
MMIMFPTKKIGKPGNPNPVGVTNRLGAPGVTGVVTPLTVAVPTPVAELVDDDVLLVPSSVLVESVELLLDVEFVELLRAELADPSGVVLARPVESPPEFWVVLFCGGTLVAALAIPAVADSATAVISAPRSVLAAFTTSSLWVPPVASTGW